MASKPSIEPNRTGLIVGLSIVIALAIGGILFFALRAGGSSSGTIQETPKQMKASVRGKKAPPVNNTAPN